jgi:hypothetical protein
MTTAEACLKLVEELPGSLVESLITQLRACVASAMPNPGLPSGGLCHSGPPRAGQREGMGLSGLIAISGSSKLVQGLPRPLQDTETLRGLPHKAGHSPRALILLLLALFDAILQPVFADAFGQDLSEAIANKLTGFLADQVAQ